MRTWTPEFPGYTPGMVVDQSNVEQFKDILDPALYDHIIKRSDRVADQGDGFPGTAPGLYQGDDGSRKESAKAER